jgi:hypothetical protein
MPASTLFRLRLYSITGFSQRRQAQLLSLQHAAQNCGAAVHREKCDHRDSSLSLVVLSSTLSTFLYLDASKALKLRVETYLADRFMNVLHQ